MTIQKKNQKNLRTERNQELLRRMRNGDSLTAFDSSSSWFPPRPTIEKDKKEMARLYENQKVKKVDDKTISVAFNEAKEHDDQPRSGLTVLPKAN